ncbi:hypothetical protein ABZ651_27930, partial [Streptomyces sp. NPDC007070]
HFTIPAVRRQQRLRLDRITQRRTRRPDLTGPALSSVTAPTLLIVGGADHTVLDLNRQAQTHLTCENHLTTVPGATHLFEEPGALEAVTDLARDWFTDHMSPARV